MVLPQGVADLVIMNPPFTRPTGQESAKIGIPVPAFAGLGTSKDEQRKMSNRLNKIRANLKKSGNVAGHGNAGLASHFLDLAHVKTKRGGIVALVLPATFISGDAWKDARRLLEREYKDMTVLTIAAGGGQTERAFSADTDMAEALVLGTKCCTGEGCGETLFVNLYHRPRSLADSFEIAREIRLLPQARHGRLYMGDCEIVGSYIRETLSQGGCAFLRETTLADTAIGLSQGMLRLPQGFVEPLATTSLGTIGKRGLYHSDISGDHNDGTPRGPFNIVPIQGVPQYPVLWRHDAQRERSLVVLPDQEGEVRPNCDDHAIRVWKKTASRLHFNLDFRVNSQSLAACITPAKALGGTAWPNFIPERDEWTLPLVLWANTILGLFSFWWIGSRQQQGRARLKITQLPRLAALDPRILSKEQITQAENIFERFREKTFLPANEAYQDDTRKALDRAVLVELLQLPETVLGPLSILRNQWCAEPSVHGGKKTRIIPLHEESMVRLKAAGLRGAPD